MKYCVSLLILLMVSVAVSPDEPKDKEAAAKKWLEYLAGDWDVKEKWSDEQHVGKYAAKFEKLGKTLVWESPYYTEVLFWDAESASVLHFGSLSDKMISQLRREKGSDSLGENPHRILETLRKTKAAWLSRFPPDVYSMIDSKTMKGGRSRKPGVIERVFEKTKDGFIFTQVQRGRARLNELDNGFRREFTRESK